MLETPNRNLPFAAAASRVRPDSTGGANLGGSRPWSAVGGWERLVFVSAVGVSLAAADLLMNQLLSSGAAFAHFRSFRWELLSFAVLAWTLLISFATTRTVALVSGVLAGGALGNLLSALTGHGWVPNPFVVRNGNGGVAYNLADIFVLAGLVAQMATLARFTISRRHALPSYGLTARAADLLSRRT